MQQITDKFKDLLLRRLREQIETVCPDFLSLSSVGSFLYAKDISSLCDVDLVVIVPRLDPQVFRKIGSAVTSLDPEVLGLPGWELRINDTFGPLKFNQPKLIVIHLMIYDLEGHKKHVEDSPFTCLDWELGRTVAGYSLRELYQAGPVTLRDLMKNRRGLETYLRDVMEGAISFRRYAFDASGKASQVKEKMICDDRHKCEYAYHIVKFSALNLYKVLHQKNVRLSEEEIVQFLKETGNDSDAADDARFFRELRSWKRNSGPVPADIYPRLVKFLSRMEHFTAELEKSMPVISFVRHAETPFNDGSFLGQRRDPDILPQPPLTEAQEFDNVWCGTLKRTIETAKLFARGKTIRQDCRLNEIDYGEAEGETFAGLKRRWPDIPAAWANLKDPHFPGGENSSEVQKRLLDFETEKLAASAGRSLAVTHNVLLRILVCNMLQVPLYHSWKFRIPHLKLLDTRLFDGRLIPAFSTELRKLFREQIAVPVTGSTCSPARYGILWQPSENACRFLEQIKEKIIAEEPEAPYCTHPVHCTFFVMTAQERFEARLEYLLADFVLRTESFRIEYNAPSVFRNDICTGGDTLIWPIVRNDALFKLQLTVADLLERFRHVAAAGSGQSKFQGEYLDSLEKYGFPFVGNHWLPHITAASVKTERGKKIIAEVLKQGTMPPAEMLDSISLFKINGDEHRLIQKFTFGDR